MIPAASLTFSIFGLRPRPKRGLRRIRRTRKLLRSGRRTSDDHQTLPRDPLAKLIGDIATGQVVDAVEDGKAKQRPILGDALPHRDLEVGLTPEIADLFVGAA